MFKSANRNNTNSKFLKIKQISQEDTGKGIIKINPEVIKELALNSGDPIEIINNKSKRRTAARVFPQKEKLSEINAIRMDPSLWRNLGAEIDDLVEIRKLKIYFAEEATFGAINKQFILKNPQALAKKLENRIFTKNDIISFNSLQGKIDLMVLSHKPNVKAVNIKLNTKIYFSNKL